MKRILLIMTLSSSGFLASNAFSNSTPTCEMTAVSGLWPDDQGGWYGSSRMDWRDCSDGNSYRATCTHRGSGESMESCVCLVNDSLNYERNCQGLVSTPDLAEASRQCCGYFEGAISQDLSDPVSAVF